MDGGQQLNVNIFKLIFGVTLSFFFIYGLIFNITPINTSKIVIIYLLIINIPNFTDLFSFLRDPQSRQYLIANIFLGVFYCFISVAKDNYEFTLGYDFFLNVFEFFFGSYLLVYYLLSLYKRMEIVLLVISIAIFIQACFILWSFNSASFVAFTNKVLPTAGNIDYDVSFRARGFSNSTGSALSITEAIGVFFSILCLNRFKKRYIRVFLYITLVVNSLSAILVGRTGILFCAVVIVAYLLLTARSLKNILSYVVFFFTVVVVIYFGFTYLNNDARNKLTDDVLPWANESFEGKNTQTVDALKNMYILPDNVSTLLIGDGAFVSENGKTNYVDADPGYVRLIFAIGIIGSLVFYYMEYKILKKTISYANNIIEKRLLIVLALLMFFIESKEPFFLKPNIIKPVFILYFLYGFYQLSLRTGMQVANNRQ